MINAEALKYALLTIKAAVEMAMSLFEEGGPGPAPPAPPGGPCTHPPECRVRVGTMGDNGSLWICSQCGHEEKKVVSE